MKAIASDSLFLTHQSTQWALVSLSSYLIEFFLWLNINERALNHIKVLSRYESLSKTSVRGTDESPCFGNRTHFDTREKASAHTAGHGTSLIITCSAAAWKCARVTFSSTEARVATSPAFVLGSPPAVSKMFPPCTTSSSTWVLHLLCRRVQLEKKKNKTNKDT